MRQDASSGVAAEADCVVRWAGGDRPLHVGAIAGICEVCHHAAAVELCERSTPPLAAPMTKDADGQKTNLRGLRGDRFADGPLLTHVMRRPMYM